MGSELCDTAPCRAEQGWAALKDQPCGSGLCSASCCWLPAAVLRSGKCVGIFAAQLEAVGAFGPLPGCWCKASTAQFGRPSISSGSTAEGTNPPVSLVYLCHLLLQTNSPRAVLPTAGGSQSAQAVSGLGQQSEKHLVFLS